MVRAQRPATWPGDAPTHRTAAVGHEDLVARGKRERARSFPLLATLGPLGQHCRACTIGGVKFTPPWPPFSVHGIMQIIYLGINKHFSENRVRRIICLKKFQIF